MAGVARPCKMHGGYIDPTPECRYRRVVGPQPRWKMSREPRLGRAGLHQEDPEIQEQDESIEQDSEAKGDQLDHSTRSTAVAINALIFEVPRKPIKPATIVTVCPVHLILP